ncbi:MAG: cytochrome c3 family protein [Planctomycetaceae bacterium]|nr:cytochrome c3 family protein [Planctomycetota bacterium]NUN51352.1 cytochrome c3 family protein [Planctomycetaceae bacterium]
MRAILLPAILLLLAGAARAGDSCVPCHEGLQDPRLSAPVKASASDIHFRRGLNCSSCHAGDGTASRKEDAHSAAKGFRVPRGAAAVESCAKCHSDAAFMKNFDPAARTDQEAQYRGSHHGQKLAAGDDKAATCVSCHGNHGVLPVKDPSSPVYPLNVPATCGRCHGSAEYMKGRKIPVDVLAKYEGSVHGKALLGRGDVGAPACNSCHGNHGATPPEIASVANVCGTCHSEQADLFRTSKKKANFDENGIAECVFCHSHHDIAPPTDAMLGTGEKSVCLQCHQDEDDAGFVAARKWEAGFRSLVGKLEDATHVLEKAERAGMEVSDPLFRLSEARDHLTQARVLIHAYDAGKVVEKLAAGEAVAVAARGDGEMALSEIDYRRRGLYVSLFAIGLLAVGIWFKIRDLDRKLPPA